MNSAGLTYGAASDAADYLNSTSAPTQDELLSALVNALNRIARLEVRIEALERAVADDFGGAQVMSGEGEPR